MIGRIFALDLLEFGTLRRRRRFESFTHLYGMIGKWGNDWPL
jgi:hypothetical protein